MSLINSIKKIKLILQLVPFKDKSGISNSSTSGKIITTKKEGV